MDPVTALAFAVCFVLGPVLYWLILRAAPVGWQMALVAVPIAALVAGALALRRLDEVTLPADLVALALLWLAWVLAVAFVALSLRVRLRAPTPRRLVLVTGLLATTLPWFGLATARLVAS